MGHLRLGQLPRTRKWQRVVAGLSGLDASPSLVAKATAEAADDRLAQLRTDPGLSYLFYLLTRVTWHAREPDLAAALRADGIAVTPNASALAIIAQIGQVAERGVRDRRGNYLVSELALRAFKETLSRAVEERSNNLFGTNAADVQRALREHSTKGEFAKLSRRFFGSFLGRLLQFIVSKETPAHVGWTRTFRDSTEAVSFESEIGQYAHQATRIIEEFSGGWYSKHNWVGDITEESSRGFVAHAITKLRDELRLSQGTT